MTQQLRLRCKCGQVRGLASQLAPRTLNHVVCYCDDCQAYAQFLQRSDLTDAQGGSEIIQLTPVQLTLSDGLQHLRCMRLSLKGLLRFYASCRNTPVANLMSSPRVPFVGLMVAVIDPETTNQKAALGPVIVRAFGGFAKGGTPRGAHKNAPLSYILRSLSLLTRAWLRGRATPTPFFDAAGKPAVEPQVLGREQRTQLTEAARSSR